MLMNKESTTTNPLIAERQPMNEELNIVGLICDPFSKVFDVFAGGG